MFLTSLVYEDLSIPPALPFLNFISMNHLLISKSYYTVPYINKQKTHTPNTQRKVTMERVSMK